MILLFLGPPGSGKGTQAKLLVRKFNYRYLESGDILREKTKEKSSNGREIQRILNEGGYVSDRIMARIVSGWLDKAKRKEGIIFDGYPRTSDQYKDLQSMLSKKKLRVDRVIYLRLSQKEVIRRLTARRICPKCDAEHNLITKPPKNDELCDRCQSKLIQREDDTKETVERRLKVQWPPTLKLINFVRNQGILEEVDGEQSIELIYQDIMKRLGKKITAKR